MKEKLQHHSEPYLIQSLEEIYTHFPGGTCRQFTDESKEVE